MRRIINASFAVLFVALAALGLWTLAGTGRNLAFASDMGAHSYAGSHAAPEFATGLDWINTGGKPLTLAQLKGKVVLLDFWTFGCANCMHVIPDLEKLEAKYPRELVVVGVHSAKFANEGQTSQIRKVVQRYGLRHAVVNDHRMQIWDDFGASAWPTIALVDPAGNAVGQVAGEGNYALLDKVIGGLVAEFDARGALDRKPLPIAPEPLPNTPLLFPGKVLADAAGQRVFIADSIHDRIVVAGFDGTVQMVIGGGRGFADGDFAHARFHQPQGLALADADTLFVADNLNNAVRRVDLKAQKVTTAAGDGTRAYLTGADYPARGTGLNTPWDLLWHDGQLYIAMAGQHQLWRYDPKTQRIARHAGSGYEALDDGPLASAGMTQPSGLSTDGKVMFVADAEASAVRTADFAPSGKLTTLVGTGLFDFGDVDGSGFSVKLQHVLGVAWLGGKVYLADTYNGKLKVLDPTTRTVATLAGGFDEPGGISAVPGKLYIADTNHHAIKVYDLASTRVTELKLLDPRKLL